MLYVNCPPGQGGGYGKTTEWSDQRKIPKHIQEDMKDHG